MKKLKVLKTSEINEELSTITPIIIDEKRDKLLIGDRIFKSLGIVKYKSEVSYGWLEKLANINNSIFCVNYKPINNDDFINIISSGIKNDRVDMLYNNDPLKQHQAQSGVVSGEELIKQIESNNETVGLIDTTVTATDYDEEDIKEIIKKIKISGNVVGAKFRNLANLQQLTFKNISPYYTSNKAVSDILNRVMPIKTFLGGFPFASPIFYDKNGYYFGKSANNSNVILDIWKRENDRTNSNMVILGVPGVGKSTVVKSMIISEYMRGTKILIIDPESEYNDLCKNLNGNLINTGGSTGGKINPLQFYDFSHFDEDEENSNKLNIHLKFLDVFFKLYLNLNEIENALLKSVLIELYERFNITWNTEITSQTIFPIMKDLYDIINEKLQDNEEYKNLSLLLKDISTGGDSFIFGKSSDITINSNCVCFDTSELQQSANNVKKAQYLNVLNYCWQEMSRNKEEKVLLVCDEAYLMIDPDVPQSLVFLRDVSKRARKYEGGIFIISHSVNDFLNEKIRMYGESLLDTPCYKLFLGTDGKNLLELKKLYNLREKEEDILLAKKRGVGVFVAGTKRFQVDFKIPSYKFKYIGAGGGR